MLDGSGVVCDTDGLNREELTRLANERVMVREFDRTKLSPKGFFVDVNDKNVALPDGSVVEDGMNFRNNFHLNPLSAADLFVPCGGRPESINMANLPQILDKDGKCKWKYLVEGANLFCTQPARLELEKLGVILFKDASANKGGVTSSSKEVTAALSLTDADFQTHMKEQADGSLPEFYKSYVKDIIECVEQNARNEFECLWQARKDTNLPFCELTDKVSLQLNAIADGIGASKLWENKKLRDVVFTEYLPKTLIGKIGLEGFYKNCPVNYQQAIFQTHLACEFVYKGGYIKSLDPFNLLDFIKQYESKSL
jgi:glutamate dehydrogenase